MKMICEQCGSEIPDGSPLGLCPRCCFLGVGAEFGKDGEIPGVELGKSIGRGGFGDVFEGVELHAGFRRVAVKILRSDFLGSARRARFLEEMQLLAYLDHGNIARFYGSGRTTSGQLYYLMELVRGKEFGFWAKTAGDAEKVMILRQVAEAVAYAHQRGVIHRDLKPSNVMIADGEGLEAKVIDFGIARALVGPESWGREVTSMEQRLGTPLYMSPEQMAGDLGIDTRSDIWSLGLLIFEAFLGRPALATVVKEEGSWAANMESLRRHLFPPLAQRELGWIARKACAYLVEDRYQSMDDLVEEIRAVEDGRMVQAGRSYTMYRLSKWLGWHWGKVATGFLLLLSLVTFAVAGWWTSVQTQQALVEVQAAQDEARVHASDAALLDATQALYRGRYPEARERLEQALAFFPENQEARYVLDYLRATVPFARELQTVEVPEKITQLKGLADGSVVMKGKSGKLYQLDLEGILGEASGWPEEGFPLPNQTGVEVQMKPSGEAIFRDLETGAAAMASIFYGSGGELACFQPVSGQLLAVDSMLRVRRWDVSAMNRPYDRVKVEAEVSWLAFERESKNLWILDSERRARKWAPDSEEVGRSISLGALSTDLDLWRTGEGHAQGIPPSSTGLLAVGHLALWRYLSGGGRLVGMTQAREIDVTLYGGVTPDGEGIVGIQWPGELIRRVSGIEKAVSLLAIEAKGQVAAVLHEDGVIEIIDPRSRRVLYQSQPLSRVSSMTITDGGRELVLGSEDGTVSVFDLVTYQMRLQGIAILGQREEVSGLQVRAVPNRREFFARADGKVVLSRFSALDGRESAPPLRHEFGVFWFCADQDFVFSIDQVDDGAHAFLRIWSLRTHRELVPGLPHPNPLTWATVLDRGRRIATSDDQGVIRRWYFREK